MNQRKYSVKLIGVTDLLMHQDNIKACARIKAWQKDPANKKASVAGDDRSPAFTWLGYCYHDGKRLVLDADNIMSMLRDGGKKCPAPTGRGSMKSATQSGIMCNEIGWPLLVNGNEIPWGALNELSDETDFEVHEARAKEFGFSLFPKRASIGLTKNVRVRPRFQNWTSEGTLTVLDDQITTPMLQNILNYAGTYCGICDWRPSSKSPGQYGMFRAEIKEI